MHIRIPEFKRLDDGQHRLKCDAIGAIRALRFARRARGIAHRTAEPRFPYRHLLAGGLHHFLVMQPTRWSLTTDSDICRLPRHFGARLVDYLHQFGTGHDHFCPAVVEHVGHLKRA